MPKNTITFKPDQAEQLRTFLGTIPGDPMPDAQQLLDWLKSRLGEPGRLVSLSHGRRPAAGSESVQNFMRRQAGLSPAVQPQNAEPRGAAAHSARFERNLERTLALRLDLTPQARANYAASAPGLSFQQRLDILTTL